MKSQSRFPDYILARIHKDRILGIRAGKDSTHRVIGIWAVIVNGRVFVRSYQLKSGGWWQALVKDSYGEIFVGGRKRRIKIRAALVKSEKLKESVSAAYKEKYNTPGSVGYVADMSRSPSKDTTTELAPV